MDGQRFDDLTRALVGAIHRRGLLKGALGTLGAALAGAAGLGGAGAAACRPAGRLCRENPNCCSGLCALVGGRKRCVCPADRVTCAGACLDPATFQSDPNNCGSCGRRCPGNRCGDPSCVDGQCGIAPTDVCTPLDECHLAGVCDPATGLCSNPAKPNGASCDDGDACTVGTTCQDGVCGGGSARDCDDGNPCTIDSCDPATGCVHTPKSCDDGEPCTIDSCDPATGACVHRTCEEALSGPCQIGYCDNGVCTSIAYAGTCRTGPGYCCRGGSFDGACSECCAAFECPLNLDCSDHCAGRACVDRTCRGCASDLECDDGDPCTVDRCDLATGLCAHLTCQELLDGPCQIGYCDNGVCTSIAYAGTCRTGPGYCCRGGSFDGACTECCAAFECPIGLDCSDHCPASETCVERTCQ